MKNRSITLSILALSTLSFAGGHIAPVEVETIKVEKESVTYKNSNFYVGLGFSTMKLENDLTDESFKAKAIILQVGYQYNQYLALEGRYTHHVGDVEYDHGNDHRVNAGVDILDYPTDFSNIAIYLKPQYTVDKFSAYALLGYGEVKLTNIPQGDVDRAEDGFQWGLGASYAFIDNTSLFVDYVKLYDDKGFDYRATNADIKVDTVTVGITYKF